MIGRIVEVADDKRHLFLSRGFLVVKETDGERKELGQVPLDDIAAVIGNAHGLSYTNNLLVTLAQRCIPFVLCGANHNTVGMLLPIDGNYQQAKRFDAQIAATKPTHKRLWAEVVRAKLLQQAAALSACGRTAEPLKRLTRQVKSGDPQNLEAQGAQKYWRLLFGDDFRRDQQGSGVNGLLNYGYTILRSAMARAVVAAGLHPTLGIHHQNEGNPMRLVDDFDGAVSPHR
jgi:CRISP-associated protein Cas1